MLDLDKLEAEREKACEDKSDLFDFYHKNWETLVAEVQALRSIKETYRNQIVK